MAPGLPFALAVTALCATPRAPIALELDRTVVLDGTWEARLSDVGGTSDEGSWQPVRVPGNFPFQGVKYDGIAWLRTTFTVPDTTRDYAIRIPMAANAYEAFVNGVQVGARGRIGAGGELVEKDLRGQVYRLPKEALREGVPNTFALRLRTFYGNGGVMAPGVLAGPEQVVRDDHDRSLARVAMLVALFLFAGFFHLVLFFSRTRERHFFSFALLCFALGSITAGINTIGYVVSTNVDFNAYLVFVPLIVLPYCFVRFFGDFFSRRILWLKRAAAGLAVLGSVSLVSSTLYHPLYPFFENVTLPVSVLALAACMALSAWWTVQAVKEKQFGAPAIGAGLVIYALTGVMELAWVFDLIPVRVDSYLGFVGFIGAMVVGIASRFAWLHRQVELGERDALTGCLTRHGFRNHVREALGEHATPSCIMLDLDHFKAINDTHGHQAGDRVLMAAGTAVRNAIRQSDLVARWGGEEFLVLLPQHGGDSALEVAARIQSALKRERFDGFEVTASFGVATRSDSAEDLDAWFARADKALYAAKEAGRDCIRSAPNLVHS
ncbi:MAG: diguanylate cyclase [Archangium sp.]|nr:diguanylate cyclase [Archangium sp.]